MSLDTLFNDCMEWLGEALPDANSLAKARAELEELADAESIVEETTDVIVCLLNYLRQNGYTVADLREGFAAKLAVLKQRKWEKQADGTYQHVPGETTSV